MHSLEHFSVQLYLFCDISFVRLQEIWNCVSITTTGNPIFHFIWDTAKLIAVEAVLGYYSMGWDYSRKGRKTNLFWNRYCIWLCAGWRRNPEQIWLAKVWHSALINKTGISCVLQRLICVPRTCFRQCEILSIYYSGHYESKGGKCC